MTEEVVSPGVRHSPVYQHEELKLNAEGRRNLYRSILEASTLDPEYLTMLVLSSLIALLGLLQNSAAVIIGAMLISPLMNPILAGGLALILGDWKLGRKSLLVMGISIGLAILVTWIAAELVPLRQPTPEILARTNPNLLDLFIAMLSGLAGTLAMRATSSAFTIIPGVAIAVAVIPPLATVGYGLSARQGGVAAGAFLLFITNLVSIMICAGVVFLLFGFRPRAEVEKGRLNLKYRIAISAAVLAVLAIPLVQTLRSAVAQIRTRSGIVSVLNQAFEGDRSSVTDVNFSRRDGALSIHAIVRTTEYFEDTAIAAAERNLQRSFGQDTRLEVEQILVTQGGLSAQQVARLRNFISGGVVQSPVEEPPFDFRASGDQLLSHLQRTVDEVLMPSGSVFRAVAPIEAQLGANQPVRVTLHLASPEPLVPQTIQVLTGQLSTQLAYPVELHARVELEGDGHTLILEKTNLQQGISAVDREAITSMLQRVAEHTDFRLAITLAAAGEPKSKPRIQQQIEALLAWSHVNPSRWTFESRPLPVVSASPPPPQSSSPTSEPSGQGAEARPVAARCEFKLYQEF